MDWMTFITEMTKALAWPAAVLIALVLLRKPLAQLLRLLSKLKYGGLELEFKQQVEELRGKVSAAVPMLASKDEAELEDRVLELVNVAPRAAVMQACRDVEVAAHQAVERHGLKLPKPTLLSAIKTLEESKLINDTQSAAVNVVRHVRNTTVHNSEFAISRRDALEVVRLAKVIEAHLANV